MHVNREIVAAGSAMQFSSAITRPLASDLTPQGYLHELQNGCFVLEGTELGLRSLSFSTREVIPLVPHNSERALRRLRGSRCSISTNRDFATVLNECAKFRIGQVADDTWIGSKLSKIFLDLHDQGYAHSVEVWRDGHIVGGMFGIQMGAAFITMSTFHQISDAGKNAGTFATAAVLYMLYWNQFQILDCVSPSNLSRSFDGRPSQRDVFFPTLRQAMRTAAKFPTVRRPTPIIELFWQPSRSVSRPQPLKPHTPDL